MSTIKISQLPAFTKINANTSNTLFVGVDIPSAQTFQFTAHTLAQGLYSNETLSVGNNPNTLPNTVAQFASNGASYVQTNLVNTDDGGTADIVVTANVGSGGTDSAYFTDMGFANKNVQPGLEFNNLGTALSPLDGYLYVQGNSVGVPSTASGGNLIIGTTTTNTQIKFIAGGYNSSNIVAIITGDGIKMVNGHPIFFTDGTSQNTAAAPFAYSNAAFAQANSASANTISFQGANDTQNTWIASNSAYSQAAFAKANTANVTAQAAYNFANTSVQNTAVIQLQSLTLSGNLIANSAGQSASIDSFTSNTATFNKNVVVLGNLTANTLLGNIFFSNVVTTTSQSNSILWFPQPSSLPQQVAQLWYYSNTQSLILDTDIAGDRLSISKVLFFRAYNSTGATIPANSFVRLVNGVTANQIPYIALADASSSANATVAGFVKNGIANGTYGFAYSQGIVEDLNSTGLGQNGDILFLSTTPGVASNVAPQTSSSNTVVQLGRIILNDAVQGKLFIQNQLRQAYGRPNGSILYAYANNIVSSNTINVNDATGTVNANTIIANTFVYGSATANAMVTQLTSKSTAVTANGMSGQITMHNAALAGQAYVTFTVNNSYVKHVNDIPFVAIQNGVTTPNPYQVCVGGVAVGSFNISVYNSDSGGGSSHSDAIVLNWGLIRVGN
jgi:hypothetical protein